MRVSIRMKRGKEHIYGIIFLALYRSLNRIHFTKKFKELRVIFDLI